MSQGPPRLVSAQDLSFEGIGAWGFRRLWGSLGASCGFGESLAPSKMPKQSRRNFACPYRREYGHESERESERESEVRARGRERRRKTP